MKIVGLMLARNEDWIIGLSARAALMWCDALVVLLHACDESMSDIVHDIGPRVVMAHWHDPVWSEMEMRQSMLNAARRLERATHIVTIDADEVLSGNLLPLIRPMIENIPCESVLTLPWLQLSHRGHSYRTSGMWANQPVTVAFRDDPRFHWAARNGYDHHHRHPLGIDYRAFPSGLEHKDGGLMHLQMLSSRRFLAKQFLYELTDKLRWPGRAPGADYAHTVAEAENCVTTACPSSWWAPYLDLMRYADIDREPWQEAECIRIIKENPGIESGMNDFGLMKKWGLK